jgi:hypothetical protein
VLTFDIIVLFGSSDETWTLYFTCEGDPGGQESATIRISRDELTVTNLISMKLQLGYSARDYLYYKRRCGNAATLHEVEYDVDANAMVACNEQERQVRLLLSKDQKIERNVNITPIKLPRMRPIREENIDDDESVDAYKHWLKDMHKVNRYMGKCFVGLLYIKKWLYYSILEKHCTNISLVVADLKDIDRDDTTKTYKEWLRVQGQLDDISNITSFPKCQPNYCYQSFTNILYLTHVTNIICSCICKQ